MITFDRAIKICQDEARDYTTDTLQIIKDDLNFGYKYVLAELGRTVTEKTRTTSTVASQQYYQCPKDFLYPDSLTVTVGTISYPVIEEESQTNWNKLNVFPQVINIPQRFFVRRSFGVNNLEIGLWPTPASAGNLITLVYEAADKDCSTLAYTDGTVSMTMNSPVVTGTGTAFTTAMNGRWFSATPPSGDGLWYRVQSADSPTQITLDQAYIGYSTAGLSYQVSEAFNLPEELQIIPCHFFLQHYFAIKGNDTKEVKNKNLMQELIDKGKARYANKGKSSVMNRDYYSRSYSIPANFPVSITP